MSDVYIIILLFDFSLLYSLLHKESLDRTDAGSVISEKEETSVKCTFTLGKVSFCYVIIVCTSRDEDNVLPDVGRVGSVFPWPNFPVGSLWLRG